MLLWILGILRCKECIFLLSFQEHKSSKCFFFFSFLFSSLVKFFSSSSATKTPLKTKQTNKQNHVHSKQPTMSHLFCPTKIWTIQYLVTIWRQVHTDIKNMVFLSYTKSNLKCRCIQKPETLRRDETFNFLPELTQAAHVQKQTNKQKQNNKNYPNKSIQL